MPSIVDLYSALKADPRLQKDWERNQPRVDRAFEAPLIVRKSREIATAILLAIKLKFEPAAANYLHTSLQHDLLHYAESLGGRATTLLKIIHGEKGDAVSSAASLHSLAYYLNRSAANPLVRLDWSRKALDRLSKAKPHEVFAPALNPTLGIETVGRCITSLAALMLNGSPQLPDRELHRWLSSSQFPGVGAERADAVGVFLLHKPWPIIDKYLWKLLARHEVISAEEASLSSYARMHAAFEPYWEELQSAVQDNANEVAATLYLWADEAELYGYSYELPD